MKSKAQIQKAHDILHAVLDGELPLALDQKSRLQMLGTARALCWVLSDGNQELQGKLERIEKLAKLMGFELHDSEQSFELHDSEQSITE